MTGLLPDSTGPRNDAPWDLSFLRVGAAVTGVLTAVAALVVGVVSTWADALTVVIGAVVVTAFFCVSAVVIAKAGRVHDSYALAAAMGTFAVKVLVLVAVLQALPADGWLDLRVLGWTVIAGALLWTGVQSRWVWTRQLYYATPPPPPGSPGVAAGPAGVTRPVDGASSTGAPADDPESRATRG